MGVSSGSAKARHWADVLAIFTGLVLLALSLYPSGATASAGAAREAGNTRLLWLVHAAAGALTIGAVLGAQRWRRRPLARALLVISAIILLAALITFRDFGPRALFTILIPAILLLISAAGIGPMPREV